MRKVLSLLCAALLLCVPASAAESPTETLKSSSGELFRVSVDDRSLNVLLSSAEGCTASVKLDGVDQTETDEENSKVEFTSFKDEKTCITVALDAVSAFEEYSQNIAAFLDKLESTLKDICPNADLRLIVR